MIITVIGAPDVGKSSLISRILIETDSIDKREIDKMQKEAIIMKKPNQWLPDLIDTDKNERERGITLHSHQEVFNYRGKNHTIINNPGHKSLTNIMIISSSKADLAIIVISSKEGEFNKSLEQAFEQSLICRIQGINKIIACINKAEYIDSNDKYETIVNTINQRLKKLRFEKIIFCPVSSKLGQNIKTHDYELSGDSLLNIIDSIKIQIRETKCIKPFENEVKAKLIFHNIPKIITKGFICSLHSQDKTYNVEFNAIKNNNLNFITPINSKGKLIDCTLNINTNDYLDTNCILRRENMTIAYGVLHQ